MGYKLHLGDCLTVMKDFADNSVDSVVCDPPYGLGKQPDMMEVLRHWMNGDDGDLGKSGFMSKSWDILPGPAIWKEVYRVLRPGGIALVFAGTRTWDLMGLALRLAGFELRDTLMWLYGSSMPKALNISKAIDAHLGAERERLYLSPNRRPGHEQGKSWKQSSPDSMNYCITAPATDAAKEWDGYFSNLKPAFEPVIVAQKKLDGTYSENALRHGVAGMWIDGCRVGTADDLKASDYDDTRRTAPKFSGVLNGGKVGQYRARTGAIPAGRWPPNVILDQQAADLLDEMSGKTTSKQAQRGAGINGATFKSLEYESTVRGYNDSGGSSRYFTVLPADECRFLYTSKASRGERDQGLEELEERATWDRNSVTKAYEGMGSLSKPMRNNHPTVKNLALMRWLCRISKTPKGGIVLDPFAGSGSTGIAALLEGREFVGIEREPEYFTIMQSRLEHWQDEADMTPIQRKGKAADVDGLPMFAEMV